MLRLCQNDVWSMVGGDCFILLLVWLWKLRIGMVLVFDYMCVKRMVFMVMLLELQLLYDFEQVIDFWCCGFCVVKYLVELEFWQGCDGLILLDDMVIFIGEKIVVVNNNLVRGFEVIDGIKVKLEEVCLKIVLCVDIFVFVLRDFVVEVNIFIFVDWCCDVYIIIYNGRYIVVK